MTSMPAALHDAAVHVRKRCSTAWIPKTEVMSHWNNLCKGPIQMKVFRAGCHSVDGNQLVLYLSGSSGDFNGSIVNGFNA